MVLLWSLMKLSIAGTVTHTSSEGPGERFALWVQGCSIRCISCCNPQMFVEKEPTTDIDELAQTVVAAREENPALEGITILGGEPFEQSKALALLCKKIRKAWPYHPKPSIMVFTGYQLEHLNRSDVHAEFLNEIDLLVDGPFDKNQPEILGFNRRWIGSSNQNIHFLSDRYLALKDNWPIGRNTVELKIKNGIVSINGFPVPNL